MAYRPPPCLPARSSGPRRGEPLRKISAVSRARRCLGPRHGGAWVLSLSHGAGGARGLSGKATLASVTSSFLRVQWVRGKMTFSLASLQRSVEGHWWDREDTADVKQTQRLPQAVGESLRQVLSKRAPGSCRTLNNLVFPERGANFIGPHACRVIPNPTARGGREVKRSFGSIPCLQAALPQQRHRVCSHVWGHRRGGGEEAGGSTWRE